MASSNKFKKLAFTVDCARGVTCSGPTQHKGVGAVSPFIGEIIGVTICGAMLAVLLLY